MLQLRIASVAWNANAKAPEAATVFLKRHLQSFYTDAISQKENKESRAEVFRKAASLIIIKNHKIF